MELADAVRRRRTVRDFDSRPVDTRIIEEAVAIAFAAPTYNHLREWDFILVSDGAVRIRLVGTETMVEEITPAISSEFGNHDAEAREMYLEAIPKQRRMILEAPCLVVATYRVKTFVRDAERVYDLNCLASAWCSIENFLLGLAAHDVFAVTFVPKNTGEVKRILGIPDDREVAAIIPFGYAKPGARTPRQKDVDWKSHLHHDRWGNAET